MQPLTEFIVIYLMRLSLVPHSRILFVRRKNVARAVTMTVLLLLIRDCATGGNAEVGHGRR